MLARLVTKSGLAPRGNRAGLADRALAFAAAVRVVAGVHDAAAHGRADAHVTLAACFTDLDVRVVDVADLADRGFRVHRNESHFAAGQTDLRIRAFLCHQLRRVARGADELRALAGFELDAVDHRADRDVRDRERVADLDVGGLAGDDHVANLEAERGDDVALLAVEVMEQRDVRRAVGIVLHGEDLRGHVVLVALEVDDTVLLARAAALVADRDLAGEVTAGILLLIFDQRAFRRLLGDLFKRRNRHEALARRDRVDFTDTHGSSSPYCEMLSKNSMPLEFSLSFT